MKYIDLKKNVRSAVFSLQDLRLLGVKVFAYQLSLWQKHGHIIRVRNGLYAFVEQAEKLLPEEIAGKIYGPSYISLEKALAIYGFIPEIVYSMTSVTPKTTRRFNNRFGSFTFRHLKPSLFFGYRQAKGAVKYLLAEPEKALLDFIYLNKDKIRKKEDLGSYRFNLKAIREVISKNRLRKYLSLFRNQKMKQLVNSFIKDIF